MAPSLLLSWWPSYIRKTFLVGYDPLPIKQASGTEHDNNDSINNKSTTTTNNNNNDSTDTVRWMDGLMPAFTPEQALKESQSLKFPKTFLWGTATAAYQVEGDLDHCNWSQWEQQKFRHSSSTTPTVEHHERAGNACNVWNLFETTDLQHLKQLGCRMYRFSVEWSRVEPQEGHFDEAVLKRYQSWCQKLVEAGIQPMITLHHFTEPDWFGGWERRENVRYFERFVQKTCHVLAPHCRYWTTINELNGYAICGWLAGVHPPGHVNDIVTMVRVVRHLLVAHTLASRAIRAASITLPDDPIICMALNHVYFLPAPQQQQQSQQQQQQQQQATIVQKILLYLGQWLNHWLSYVVSLFLNYVYNFIILDALFSSQGRFPLFPFPFHILTTLGGWNEDIRALQGSADWIGVNHYYRNYVQFGRQQQQQQQQQRQQSPTDIYIPLPLLGLELRATSLRHFEKNEMGWDVTPSSMERLLNILWDRYQPIPIIITESGTADRTDRQRVRYIAAILKILHDCSKNMDIRGYLIWTLMDNFEWAEGYRPKFGLLETNFDTLERTERTWTCNLLRAVFSSSSSQ